jgi:hypothetical protein
MKNIFGPRVCSFIDGESARAGEKIGARKNFMLTEIRPCGIILKLRLRREP